MFKTLFAALIAVTLSLSPAATSPAFADAKFPVAHPSHKSREQEFLNAPVAPADMNLQGIRLVRCSDAKEGLWSGSMVHVGPNTYITAAHVAAATACYDAVTHVKLTVAYFNKHLDFAIFQSPMALDSKIYKMSCDHFRSGMTYHAVGWAGGDDLTNVDLVANDNYTDDFFIIEGTTDVHLKEFKGTIIGGQSGGAVFDKNWTVIGINNASWDEKDLSWSRELRDTPICSK